MILQHWTFKRCRRFSLDLHMSGQVQNEKSWRLFHEVADSDPVHCVADCRDGSVLSRVRFKISGSNEDLSIGDWRHGFMAVPLKSQDLCCHRHDTQASTLKVLLRLHKLRPGRRERERQLGDRRRHDAPGQCFCCPHKHGFRGCRMLSAWTALRIQAHPLKSPRVRISQTRPPPRRAIN